VATTNFSAILDVQTRGSQELQKLEEALRKVVTQAENAGKKTGDALKPKAVDISGDIQNFISNPLETAKSKALDFAKSYGTMGIAVASGATVLAAGGAAILTLAANAGALAEAQSNAALKLGVSVKEYGLYSQAAENAGLSADALLGTVKGLSLALSSNSEEGRKGKEALRELGIETTNAFGTLRPTAELLLDIADGLGAIPSPADRATTAVKILGRGGIEALPLLNSELRGTVQELDRLGTGFDELSAEKALRFDSALDRVTTKLKNMAREAGVAGASMLEALFPTAFDSSGKPGETQARLAAQKRQMMAQFEAELNDQKIIERGGILPFVGVGQAFKGPQGVSQEDLGNEQIQARRRVIQGILKANATLQDDLVAARKRLDAAIDANDVDLVRQTQGQIKSIEASIKNTEDAKRKAEDFRKKQGELDALIQQQFLPSVLRSGRGAFNTRNRNVDLSDLASADVDIGLRDLALGRVPGQGSRDAIEGRGSDSVRGLLEQRKNAVEDLSTATDRANERARRSLDQELDLQTRKIELLAGPGGEVAAIEKITQLRLASLEKQKSLGVEIFDIELERSRILQDREIRLIEIQRQRLDEVKNSAGQVFDALTRGGAGIREFLLGQIRVPARQIFQNLAGEIFSGTSGKLTVPGQTGADGKPNVLGRVLNGTMFGLDPLKSSTDLNTQATIANTAALLRSSSVSGTLGSGGGLSQALGIPGLFGGAGTNGIFTGFESAASVSRGTQNLGLIGMQAGFPVGGGASPRMSGLTRGIGYAGAIAGGAYGAYQGFSSGGVQGALSGTGSLAGAAGSILALSGVAGPAAPILAGVGLALGVVSSLIGNPKQRESERVAGVLESRRFNGPPEVNIESDLYGRGIYQDFRGNMRPTTIIYQTNNINAIDSRDVAEFFEENTAGLDRGLNRLVADGGGSSVPALQQAMGVG
jgi:hypothetical protein